MSFQTLVLEKLAQLNSAYNSLLSNSKKIEELPAQTSLDLTSKFAVSRGGVSEHIPLQLLATALANNTFNGVVSIDGDITVAGNDVTIPAITVSFQDTFYTKATTTVINTPFTTAVDLEREDWLVFNTVSGNVERVEGDETAGVVVPPSLPANCVFIAPLSITDTTVGVAEQPFIGEAFVKKSFAQPFLFNGSGTNQEIPLDPLGREEIRLTNASLESVKGFNLSLITGVPSAEVPFIGKEYTIRNLTGTDVTLKHNDLTAGLIFLARNSEDVVIPDNEDLTIKYGGGGFYEYLRSWSDGGGSVSLPFALPEDFGAVGDGTTDDTTAIQNAINSSKPVLLGAKSYLVSSLTVSDNKGIFGLGFASELKTTSDATVINITGSRNTFKNFKIIGNNTGTSQHGIKAVGVSGLTTYLLNNIVDGLYIFDLGGEGIGSEYMVGSSAGSKHEGAFIVNNTVINNCLYGVYLYTRAEYNVFSNTRIQSCENGFIFSGGNNSFNGGAIVNCTYGIRSLSGSNDAHSQFSGTMINHNDYNVWTNHGSTYNFDGCTIYIGNIRVQGGTTQFTGCQISFGTGTSFVSTTSKAYFSDCQFASLPPTVSGANAAILKNCYYNGNLMTTIDKHYDRDSTRTSDFTFTIPKGSFIKNILIHNTTANEITGGLRIGTTSGGQEVVSDTAIDANYINSLTLNKTAFSETADTTIYVQAVTAWNSASIRFIIDLDVFKI